MKWAIKVTVIIGFAKLLYDVALSREARNDISEKLMQLEHPLT
jgi:hypothetical protein